MERKLEKTENSKIYDLLVTLNERIRNAENERDSALLEASYLQSILKSQISTIHTGSIEENLINGIEDMKTHINHEDIFRQIENEALTSLETSAKINGTNSTTHDSRVATGNNYELPNKISKAKGDDTSSTSTNNRNENKQNQAIDSSKNCEIFEKQNTGNIDQLMFPEPIFDSNQSTELRRYQTETPIHQLNGYTIQSDNFEIFPNKLNILENSMNSQQLSPTLFPNEGLHSVGRDSFLPNQIPDHVGEINPIHILHSSTTHPQSSRSFSHKTQDCNEQTNTICQCRLVKLLHKLQILTNQCRNHLKNCDCTCNTGTLCKKCSLTGNIESHQHANVVEVKNHKLPVKTVTKVSTTKPSWRRHASIQSKNKEISVSPRLPKYCSPLINKFNSCEPKITKGLTSKIIKNQTLNNHFSNRESAHVFIPVKENISLKQEKLFGTGLRPQNQACHVWPGVEVITTIKPLSFDSPVLKSKLESDTQIETDLKKKIVSHNKPVLYTVRDNSEPVKLNRVSWKSHT